MKHANDNHNPLKFLDDPLPPLCRAFAVYGLHIRPAEPQVMPCQFAYAAERIKADDWWRR